MQFVRAAGRHGVSVDVADCAPPRHTSGHRRDHVVPRPAAVASATEAIRRVDERAFLYDDSFLHDHVSRSTLRAHGDAIELKPGVAHGLARLAGLLKPALEIMWVEDVRRMNKFLDAEVPDVAGHLFGRERTALAVVREPFKDAFGPHCFYCGTHLPANNPIDHVLPWSLVGIDGLANLVLACARCNSDKSGALPAVTIVDRVLSATETCWNRSHPKCVADPARPGRGGGPGYIPRATGGRADLVGLQAERAVGHQLSAVVDMTSVSGGRPK